MHADQLQSDRFAVSEPRLCAPDEVCCRIKLKKHASISQYRVVHSYVIFAIHYDADVIVYVAIDEKLYFWIGW